MVEVPNCLPRCCDEVMWLQFSVSSSLRLIKLKKEQMRGQNSFGTGVVLTKKDFNAQVSTTLEKISENCVCKMVQKIHTSLLLLLFIGWVGHRCLISWHHFGDKYGHRGYNTSCNRSWGIYEHRGYCNHFGFLWTLVRTSRLLK